jgi:hypothetical protein
MADIRGVYKHFKGGTYEVFGVCSSKSANQTFVLYKPLYNNTGLWVRLYSMFFSKVTIDGKQKDRFAFLEYINHVIAEKEFSALHSETHEKIDVLQETPGNFIVNL